MNLTSKPLAAIIVVVFMGGIAFSSTMGWWATESSKQAATFTEGEFAGEANPADIRGSYTFGDVEKNFDIPADILVQAFQVESDDPAAYPVKSLEEIYAGSEFEVGTASVRLFVSFYNNLPIDLSTDMYLPEAAAAILEERNLTPEQSAYLETHIVPAQAPAETGEIIPTVVPTQEQAAGTETAASEDYIIKGKTTFGDLTTWGVPKESIEAVLGIAMPDDPALIIKEFTTTQGLDFEVLKPALQAEVDKVKP